VPRNAFYSEFDEATLEPGVTRGGEVDHRNAFMVDRDRILYAPAFRRLQAKTQVFLSGEYDFYRTRLTHSLEVAQIGRAICHALLHVSPELGPDFHIDPDLVEGICLAHDIGHPPFGHAGERALHDLMRGEFGGFEGNAQTLRILTSLFFRRSSGGKVGMNPTRALLDGILKYKAFFSETPEAAHHFVYDQDRKAVEFAVGGPGAFEKLPSGAARNREHSVENQIMDWADDTAYSLNDMMDGIQAGFLRMDRVRRWAESGDRSRIEQETATWLIETMHTGKMEARFSRKIGEYVAACRLEKREHPFADMSNRYRYCLVVDPRVKAESTALKTIARDLVFRSPPLQQLEYKGREIITRLFDAFLTNYEHKEGSLVMASADTDKAIRNVGERAQKARLICDYIAGMTDSFAVRVHRRLFDPEYSGITDY